MSNQILMYLMGGTIALLVIIIIAYVLINKALNKGDRKYVRELRKGTKEKSAFSSEILYQKLYTIYIKVPRNKKLFIKIKKKIRNNKYRRRISNKKTCIFYNNKVTTIVDTTYNFNYCGCTFKCIIT